MLKMPAGFDGDVGDGRRVDGRCNVGGGDRAEVDGRGRMLVDKNRQTYTDMWCRGKSTVGIDITPVHVGRG